MPKLTLHLVNMFMILGLTLITALLIKPNLKDLKLITFSVYPAHKARLCSLVLQYISTFHNAIFILYITQCYRLKDECIDTSAITRIYLQSSVEYGQIRCFFWSFVKFQLLKDRISRL